MMINHSIYKVGFLNLIAPNSFFEISDYFSFRKFWFKFVRLWHSCCPLVSLRTGNRFFLDYIVLIFWSKGQGLFTLLWSPKANKWICCENICHVLLKNLCSANNIARSPYIAIFVNWSSFQDDCTVIESFSVKERYFSVISLFFNILIILSWNRFIIAYQHYCVNVELTFQMFYGTVFRTKRAPV